MILASLPKLIRYIPAIFIAAVILTVASIAHASMICWRIEKLHIASDPLARKQLETHVRALPGFKNYEIRDIDGRFFIAMGDDGYCKDIPHCQYRLLDLRNGVVKNVFAFRGAGMVWRLLSPLGGWVEKLQDEYSAWAFATTENTFISVELPRFRDMIVIDSPGPEETKTFRAACSALMK